MAVRAMGALLGLVAVTLFAVSLASPKLTAKLPAWWDGHPVVDGKPYERMDAHIGLLGAERCFDGGERCSPTAFTVGSAFSVVSMIELAIEAIAALVAIALTISIWSIGDRRKRIARTTLAIVVVAAAGSALLVLVGPGLSASQDGRSLAIDVPLGAGVFLFWGALVANAGAAILALRLEPEPLRLKPSTARPNVGPPTPPRDVRELLREQHDALRPAALGPEPKLGQPPNVPRGVPTPPSTAPLVDGAPQLRPLYDVQGAAPVVAPIAMPAPPEPVSRSSMRQIAGIDTPPPKMPARRETPIPHEPAAGPPPLRVPTLNDSDLPARPKSATAPPPRPPPSPSAPPPPRATPVPGAPPPPRPAPSPSASPPPRPAPSPSASPPPRPAPSPSTPPPPRATPLPTAPSPRTATPPGLPPPPRPAPSPSTPPPRAARPSQIPPALAGPPPRPSPMPNRIAPPMPAKRPAPPREGEPITSVEIDAEAKASARAAEALAASGRMAAVRDVSTAEERALAFDELGAPRATLGDIAGIGDHTDQVNAAIGDASHEDSSVVQAPPPEPPPLAPPPEPPAAEPPARASQPQVPLSTAPTSLPPPKTVQMPAGPTPACPQCESPMAWVEEHLRFYCKQCRMYF